MPTNTRKLLLVFFLYLPAHIHAGVEIELAIIQQGPCTIRVSHDATPQDSTGTLVVKSYRQTEKVHEPCSPAQRDLQVVLNKALATYPSLNLKPISSVFIGRLIHYAWIRSALEEHRQTHSPDGPRMSRDVFQQLIVKRGLIKPFEDPLLMHAYRVNEVQCEKMLRFSNGSPQDALCWLIIQKTDPTH